MKTYIYYYQLNGKTYTTNFKAKDINEAKKIEGITGYELKGELLETIIVNNEN